MADLIQLLPDAIANQIAAGEVIQRPASAVKELMENAIDAGSTEIKLIIKDAGKALIQIVDNGCGMSDTDARMSFERHATSKIREANDLFAIRTMGFRGEALASIAAVAQVEMRTRRYANELGVRLVIEGSEVKTQEACQTAPGTSISIKNLFYNVPARRNFLKSNSVEMRHIVDEFQRLALANPDITFSMHHNGNEMYHLLPGNLRQRINGVFGKKINQKIVPIAESTDVVEINGFVGKPEFSTKKRGNQFFFVNDRFIKSAYLHHAVMGAYEGIMQKDTYPFYVIKLDIDPQLIDINVHPTKQEIKFEDERLIYNYLKVSVRHALGSHNVTPTLDFDIDTNFGRKVVPDKPHHPSVDPKPRTIPSSMNESSSGFKPMQQGYRPKQESQDWQKLFEGLESEASMPTSNDEPVTLGSTMNQAKDIGDKNDDFSKPQTQAFQMHNTYIVSPIKSGFMLIDQQSAHQRILYEQYLEALESQQMGSQQQLFPTTLELDPGDALILNDIIPELKVLGFEIEPIGQKSFMIQGVPAEMAGKQNEIEALEILLDQYRNNMSLKLNVRENVARSLAYSASVKKGVSLEKQEMQEIIDRLFACATPFKSPLGRNTFITFELDELLKRFES